MTRKQFLAVAGLLAVLIGGWFGIRHVMPRAPDIVKENFKRIANGMTIGEVESLLGQGDYAAGELGPRESVSLEGTWHANDGSMVKIVFGQEIRFDQETGSVPRVQSKMRMPSTENIFARIGRWLLL